MHATHCTPTESLFHHFNLTFISIEGFLVYPTPLECPPPREHPWFIALVYLTGLSTVVTLTGKWTIYDK